MGLVPASARAGATVLFAALTCISDRSDALIRWAAQHFCQAQFVLYEQMHPEDPFGHIMQQHFSRLNSALHGLAQYPDREAQRRRFLQQVGAYSWGNVQSVRDGKEQDF